MNVVIAGAGAIGAAIAYFLLLRGVRATVVERCSVACAASGKSGGFIARDWCAGQPQDRLARFSFDLHADLAVRFADRYGYRRIRAFAVAVSARRSLRQNHEDRPEWVNGDCMVRGTLGDETTTAQLDPAAFTQTLMDAAVTGGASLRIGTVDHILLNPPGNRVTGVIVDGDTIRADTVVVAMGPWCRDAARWLPMPAVYGSKGYSIILRPESMPPAQALFVEYENAAGVWHGPEMVPRANGDVYLYGFGDDSPVPDSPDAVAVDGGACDELRDVAARLSPGFASAPVGRRQACYRPICQDAMPVMGPVPGVAGAYVATGHNCWGMLNAPGSGYAMAELIVQGESRELDLAPFDPARFPTVRV